MTESTDELFAQGTRALQDGDVDIAARILERAVATNPDDADVRHALGCAYEALGRIDAMKREFMQVRLLDAEADRRAGLGNRRDMRFIENVAAEVMASLPDPFRRRLAHIPVVLEKRPSLALVRTGFDPRALGLFEGANILEGDGIMHTSDAPPARVVVFSNPSSNGASWSGRGRGIRQR